MKAIRAIVAVACVSGAAGCAGPMFEGTIFEQPQQRDPTVARIVTNTQQMNMEFRQMAEQLTALNRNQELVEARLTKLENQITAAPQTSEDITALRRDLQLIRAERETLKKEITDDLAGRIERIAVRQQADINAARSAAATSSGPARVASGSKTVATARPSSGYEHKVERGQTLSEIARGYGKSLDVIMKANKITNPSSIRVGQVLFIPD